MSNEPKTQEEKARKEFKERVEYGSRYDRLIRGSGARAHIGGLCSKCDHLRVSRTSLGRTYAICTRGMSGPRDAEADSLVNPHDPIVECSEFWPRGAVTLEQMADQARYITTVERMGQYL